MRDLITIRRILEVDNVQLYVKVTIAGRRVEIVWDKHIPLSKVKQLLAIIFNTVIPSVLNFIDDASVHKQVKLFKLHYDKNDEEVVEIIYDKEKIKL